MRRKTIHHWARQYVVWTSAFSMITLFLWIFLLRAAGLL